MILQASDLSEVSEQAKHKVIRLKMENEDKNATSKFAQCKFLAASGGQATRAGRGHLLTKTMWCMNVAHLHLVSVDHARV